MNASYKNYKQPYLYAPPCRREALLIKTFVNLFSEGKSMYFKVVLEGGHAGAGKSFEMVRYLEAENAIVLLKYLETYPALKFKSTGRGITLVQPVSKEEYLAEKDIERNDPYSTRQYVRFDVKEKFLLASRTGDLEIEGRTIDYSNGGMGVSCTGRTLPLNEVFSLTVETLGIIRKKVRVAWVRPLRDGYNAAGLKWL